MSTIQNRQPGDGDNKQSDRAEQNQASQHQTATAKTKKSATAFRTISEVADELGVQQHVLRFWETKFSQVKPLKRGGGRRYYRPEDVALLKKIHHLLYTEGYTIKGVQKLMKGQGKQQLIAEDVAKPVASNRATPAITTQPRSSAKTEGLSDRQRAILQSMLGDLKELRDMLKGDGNEE